MKKLPLRLAVLASGRGRNFAAIAKASLEGRLSAEVVGLISNKSCGAIDKAKDLRIPHQILPWSDAETWGKTLIHTLQDLKPDLILLAGFLKMLSPEVVQKFRWRILNLHPSLLPKYGGPGMYGLKVFEAVLKAKEKQTGATLHFVTEQFDEGPVLNQLIIPVLSQDTPEVLMDRVQSREPDFYVETLSRLERGEFDERIRGLKS